jgi:dTDP-4-dehydrorhamnose reductase
MTKILITGANGQLGQSFKQIAEHFLNFKFLFIDLPDVDMSVKVQLGDFFEGNIIDFVINCAAYTDVDKAETEVELTFETNLNIVNNLCELSQKYHFKIIQISTDYVFDGNAENPYETNHPTNPIGVYGKSKEAAEEAILNAEIDAWIVRTSWLFSPFGNNFVKTIFSLLQNKSEISVVADQSGTPTYAQDLAQFILLAISQKPDFKGTEIYHFTNTGIATWLDLARAIKKMTNNTNCIIHPVESKDFPAKAKRPKYAALSCEKTKKEFNLKSDSWELALNDCLKKLKH